MTARRTLATAAAAGIVVVLRVVAGVWITAAVVAGVATVGLVAGWAAIERRAVRRQAPAPGAVVVVPRGLGRPPYGDGRHLAFARALAVVAAAYLDECERDERGETWR